MFRQLITKFILAYENKFNHHSSLAFFGIYTIHSYNHGFIEPNSTRTRGYLQFKSRIDQFFLTIIVPVWNSVCQFKKYKPCGITS